MKRSGLGFRLFVGFFLVGIFFELIVIIGVLVGETNPVGDVVVVEVAGLIEDPLETTRELKRLAEDDRVKAIVLRIESGGGHIGASQEIHDAVAAAAAKKKLVASMGNIAASGGYYIAVPAHKIVATPGTITCSIGVIAQFLNIEKLLEKAHVRWEVIKAGDIKDIGSPFRDMTEQERKVLQTMTDDMHDQFIEAVAKGRKMAPDAVRKLADGQLLSGRQAKKAGLVDELGGLEKAIAMAAKMAGVKGKPKVVYPKRESFGWLKQIAEGKFETSRLKLEYRAIP